LAKNELGDFSANSSGYPARLGEFSPIWRLFASGSFFNYRCCPHFVETFFHGKRLAMFEF
jgi:hypothetical protein